MVKPQTTDTKNNKNLFYPACEEYWSYFGCALCASRSVYADHRGEGSDHFGGGSDLMRKKCSAASHPLGLEMSPDRSIWIADPPYWWLSDSGRDQETVDKRREV